ncbi:MAG: class I SAM-dependent rRNA methyltransferase [Erysipelotrichia bacterium]|nr:class I SAM-dependent rRNA methyltransferase [Erysipelotrichia bacterium]
MKQERTYPQLIVTKKQEKVLKAGHPWVYEDEITSPIDEIENGSLVDVCSQKNIYLGTGIYSVTSKIRVRILDVNANETFQMPFFARRVAYALQYRRDVMGEDWNACRLIHGESDGLPGVTIDRYESILVSEILSYGMEQRKQWIYQSLIDQLSGYGVKIDGIYERCEGELRTREGLDQHRGWVDLPGLANPESPVVIIHENGIAYEVDVENGQKTGFFLDQKYNRVAVRKISEGRRVLDCCTHTGSFAMNAAIGKAEHVTAVDISETALASARRNAAMNNLDQQIEFVQADVFDILEQSLKEHQRYDFIVLDPPAFTKSRKTREHAYNGYLKINTLAMRLLPRGGYLATCSCSHFMPSGLFKSMLKEAAEAAGVRLRMVEERHAAMDHPVLISVPETDYLKFFLVQIL